MNNQVLAKLNIADFYALNSKLSAESLEYANNLLKKQFENRDNSLSNNMFLAGIKQWRSPEYRLDSTNDLESILNAAAAAGYEVEITSV